MAGSGSSNLSGLAGTAPAGLTDWSVQIGTLLLSTSAGYLITGWDGFGSAEVRSADVARVQEDGDWMGRDSYASRTLTLTIKIKGSSPAGAEALYQALLGQWYSDPSTPYNNLWWKLPGLPAYRAIGKPRRIVADKSRLLSGIITATAEFYSPFACLLMESQTSTLTPLTVTGGGRTYPLLYPRLYSVTTSGGAGVFVNNTGTYPAWSTITITGGAATNPRVNNQTTGAFIGFDLTLAATDVLLIDMRLRTATLNGVNARQYLSAGASWFQLPPQTVTEVLYVPQSFSGTTSATFTFAPALLG